MKIDNLLRKVVPSVSLIGHSKFIFIIDWADSLVKLFNPKWSKLPPASLRMRIGGKIILFSHDFFIESGRLIIKELSKKGYLRKNSNVLEMGCGCGRNAIQLIDFLDEKGTYHGQDVDKTMIEWCKNNLQDRRFSFSFANIYSEVYNPEGQLFNDYKFPVNDKSQTLIFSISVFSHLLYKDFHFYVKEANRVLEKDGILHMTLFIMDYIKPKLGDRWTFEHKVENCYIENIKYPEAAVAYDIDVVKNMIKDNGLEIVEIYNLDSHQQTLIARKL